MKTPSLIPLLLVAASILIGCGKLDRPDTVPVSGQITFQGQSPDFPGAIFFAPIEVEEGYPRRGGRALFDNTGKFEATCFEQGDGLIPGTYRVRVESWKQPPSMGQPGVSYIPKHFSPDDLVVSSKQRVVQLDLELSP